jgi:nitroreductase
MNNEELYRTIFRRKSIRKYDMTPLPAAMLTDLQEFARHVRTLDTTIRYEYVYLGTDEVKNMLPIKAPHYICLYSEKKDGYLMNAGFLLQQIDLYLSAKGIGSCWLGMAKPSKQVTEPKGDLEFIIMIAFGGTGELVHRTDTSVFIRRSISAISQIDGAGELLEPVRLAPSASNSQPWFFSGSPEEIDVSREKPGFLKAPLYERMNQIDIGIALCHLWLSLEHRGKTASVSFPQGTPPKGHEYMAKVIVGNIK